MASFDFSGKRVVVTGASHGIGRAVATEFARSGAELVILSSTSDISAAAASIGAETGRPVQARVCDISNRQAVKSSIGTLGSIDVLINNAGLELITPMDELGDEVERTFVRIIEVNV